MHPTTSWVHYPKEILYIFNSKYYLNQKLIIYRERLVNTLYFNGRKLTERLEDTPEGRNKWHAGGQWFLGQDQVCYFINCFFILKFRKY